MITNLQLTTQSLHPHPNLRALTSFFKVFQDNFPLLQVLMGPNANLGFTNKLMTYLINLEEKSHPYIPVSIQKLNPDMFSYYSISSLIGIIQFWRKIKITHHHKWQNFSLKFVSVLLKNSKTNEDKAKYSDKKKNSGLLKSPSFFLIASSNKTSQNFYFSSS